MSDIDTAELAVRLSGAVSASAGGFAGQLTLAVSGASRWTASELRSPDVTANVSGASYGFVRASESLLADVSGASVLEYLGDPRVASRVDGLSVLRRVGP